jgi:DNA-binding response OmpR family regulator
VKVLLIDDNQQVVRDISSCLRVRYPDVIIISIGEGRKGIEMIETESPDLVMANSSLPDMDILDLMSEIRDFSDVPLIILYETASEIDRARGLEMGADEYINKPVNPIELLARVNALLRRTGGLSFKPERVISIGSQQTIDHTTRQVIFSTGERIKLTPIEYHLLSELVRNEGKVLTHSTILERVWGSEHADDYSHVKKYIYRLRFKLESHTGKQQMILTERGIGYKFVKPI